MRHGVQGDLIDVLTTDHLVMAEMFGKLEGESGDAGERKELADEVTAELMRHSAVKQKLLYPLVRETLPHGEALVVKELQEHEETEVLLRDMGSHQPGDREFENALSKLVSSVRHEVEHEEDVLFAGLAAECDPEQLRWLGTQVAETKEAAPTRPRPESP